jgi:hexosaminidase
MRGTLQAALFSWAILCFGCQTPEFRSVDREANIIPYPSQIEFGHGTFDWELIQTVGHDPGLESEADLLADMLEEHFGRIVKVTGSNDGGEIRLSLNTSAEQDQEQYSLDITKDGVQIEGTAAGVFYGIQTLMQMMTGSDSGTLPFLSIEDAPRFKHRGMLLDCCRHFFSVQVVKKYIDLLARYKMNVLHWHLTEDQGWRIAIDAYPALTKVGAWRKEADGSSYGGFYSKDDIEEVVQYASARHITVIPEIELPGHSLAALASYPHLGCTGGPYEVTHEWGVFKDVYCPGKESTFEFLETVLTEVMEMFPSAYIHIGGDESPKFRWEICSDCQHRMEEEGLQDTEQLQAYFIQRIQRFLQQHGREIIGWDEILEGGLAFGAVVQGWRGMEGAIEAHLG